MSIVLDSKIPSGPLDQKWEKHKFESKLINPANKRKYEIIVVSLYRSVISLSRAASSSFSMILPCPFKVFTRICNKVFAAAAPLITAI